MIDRVLADDKSRPKKQQHTAKRIFERLRDKHGFKGGITIVKDERGHVLAQVSGETCPVASFEALRAHCDCPERIVLETGSRSDVSARSKRRASGRRPAYKPRDDDFSERMGGTLPSA